MRDSSKTIGASTVEVSPLDNHAPAGSASAEHDAAVGGPTDGTATDVVDKAHKTSPKTHTGKAPNSINLANLVLPQNFGASLGVKKVITTVGVHKPPKETFVQVHPDENYRFSTCVLELKEEREMYLVARELWADLAGEATFSPRALFTTVTRQGSIFVWPIRLPGADGKIDSWNEAAMQAAQLAQGQWVRIAANMDVHAYDVFVAPPGLAAPKWPEASFEALLQIAFKGKFIDNMDHIVLKKLRGEV